MEAKANVKVSIRRPSLNYREGHKTWNLKVDFYQRLKEWIKVLQLTNIWKKARSLFNFIKSCSFMCSGAPCLYSFLTPIEIILFNSILFYSLFILHSWLGWGQLLLSLKHNQELITFPKPLGCFILQPIRRRVLQYT